MSFTKTYYHLIFTPKGRIAVISEAVSRDMYMLMFKTFKQYGAFVHRIGGMPDHIHVLLEIPVTIAISKFVQAVKRETSLHAKNIIANWPGWQEGYGIFSCSYSQLPLITQYISSQKEHHKKLSFVDEYRQWLIENGVSEDEPYFPK